jgi:transcriptional regulator with XRE-family HTH domain
MPTFSERFKALRKEKGLTQEKLAQHFYLNKSSISRYEKNQQMPETDALQSFADYFEVSIDYLLGRTDVRDGHINKSEEEEYNPSLTPKDERDIGKMLDKTLQLLENQQAVMLDGELLDEEDIQILAKSIKAGLEYAKISNKKKYTPKKYRNNRE